MDMDLGEIAIVGAIVGLLGFVAAAMVKEHKHWQQFKADHHCKVVAQVSGDVFTTVGIGSNGQVTTGVGSTGSKTGWLCDDGVTYYR